MKDLVEDKNVLDRIQKAIRWFNRLQMVGKAEGGGVTLSQDNMRIEPLLGDLCPNRIIEFCDLTLGPYPTNSHAVRGRFGLVSRMTTDIFEWHWKM